MRITKLIIIALALLSGFGFGQIPNANLFNTASNAQGNGVLAYNVNDLNWSASNTGLPGSFIPAKVCSNQAPCCWQGSNAINNDWITYPHTCSSSIAEHSCSGNVDLYYKLSFTLPSANNCGQEISNPGAYCLALDLLVDNCLHQVYVNGNSVYISNVTNPYGHYGFLYSGQVSLQLCNFWKAGTNNVIFHTKSGAPSFPGWSGFMAKVNTALTSSNAPCTSIGIDELNSNSHIQFFPNPTHDKFTISLNPNDELPQSISVRSVLGNEVKKINSINERNLTIDLGDCSDGVYIVNVNYANKTITNKIVKTSSR